MKNVQKMLCALILGLAIVGNLDAAKKEDSGAIRTGNTGTGPRENKKLYEEKQRANVKKKKTGPILKQEETDAKQLAHNPGEQALAKVKQKAKRVIEKKRKEENLSKRQKQIILLKNQIATKTAVLKELEKTHPRVLINYDQEDNENGNPIFEHKKDIADLTRQLKDLESYRIGTRAYGTALAGLSGAALYTCIKNLIQEGPSLKNVAPLFFAIPFILSAYLLISPHNAKARALMASLFFIVAMGTNIYINGFMDNN